MTNRISSSVNILISSFLLAAANTFCKPCHGLMTMPCERSTRIACIALAVIIAASILRFFLKKGARILTVAARSHAGGLRLPGAVLASIASMCTSRRMSFLFGNHRNPFTSIKQISGPEIYLLGTL